jgi:hypothetical protein
MFNPHPQQGFQAIQRAAAMMAWSFQAGQLPRLVLDYRQE